MSADRTRAGFSKPDAHKTMNRLSSRPSGSVMSFCCSTSCMSGRFQFGPERNRPGECRPDRGRRDHVLVKFLDGFLVGRRFDPDPGGYVFEPRKLIHVQLFRRFEPEEARQIDLSFEVYLDVVDLDVPDRG